MKQFFKIVLLALLPVTLTFSDVAQAQTVIAHTSKAAGTSTTLRVTIDPINITGASLVIIGMASDADGATDLPTDNTGSTFSHIATSFNTDQKVQWYYTANPVTSTAYTASIGLTICLADCFIGITVAAFSGSLNNPLDKTNTNTATVGVTALTSGLVTPSVNNELIAAIINPQDATTASIAIDSGLSIIENLARNPGVSYGVALAYKFQTAAAAINPQWTWTTNATAVASAATFAFQAGSSGGITSNKLFRTMGVGQ